MFSLRTVAVISAFSAFAYVQAAETLKPTGPGPKDSYKIGGDCVITFLPDTSGASTWKNMTIDFMTGANQAMTMLANVATNIDGTSASSSPVTWTCPEVDPPSAIYFYQFTHGDEQDPMWTTRFLITDAEGNSVDPPESKQPGPDGEPIPWGTGKLIGSASSGSSSGSGSSGSSGSSSGASSSTASSTASQSEESESSSPASSTLSSQVSSPTTNSSQRPISTSTMPSGATMQTASLSAAALVAAAACMAML